MLSMETTRSTGLGIASGAALYVGAVLGPGVLLVPALAAQAAGPASVLAWAGAAGRVAGHRRDLRRARRAPPGRRRRGGVRARGLRPPCRRGHRLVVLRRAWWAARPRCWLIGGFYVAHLTGGGRAVAVAAAAAMMVAVLAANARGLRATARMQLGLAALLAVLLLVAVGERAALGARGQLDAVRAARVAGGRHRGEPADAVLRGLGGGRAPGRRLRGPAPAAAARDARARSPSSPSSTSAWR